MRNRPHDRHVIIFAKAPRLGRVKTRLAHDIGDLAALRFYLSTLAGVVHRLAADPRWRVWLAVTPDGAVLPPMLRVGGVARRRQGKGDLGARMGRALRGGPPGGMLRGSVMIIGGDIPAITPEHIWRAFSELAARDYIFGPATDGGYWLVGARGRGRKLSAFRPRLFQGVRWSTAHALSDTLANVTIGETIGIADTLRDVDEAKDLVGR